MPTIVLNKKEFEKLIKKKLSLEELKERISMLGTDLEKIEGGEIVVEVFPDRPDMLSEQGFARAFNSFIGAETGLKKYLVKKSNKKVVIMKSVKEIRPFTACALVKNLCFNDKKIKEIIQIQEKLHLTYGRNRRKLAIGIYPLEKIKFPVYYLAEEPEKIRFRPLDYPVELSGKEILKKHKAGKEYGWLLQGLPKYPLFRDANQQILSMPPIINSHLTGKIDEKTKDLFIECSGFDFEILKKGLNILVTTLAEMGGEIFSLELDYCFLKKKEITPDLKPEKMALDFDYVNRILGLTLNKEEIKNLLGRMGFGYEKGKVLIPSYRVDILHPIDLVEEIAIAYGYENFIPEIPQVMTIGEEDSLEKFLRKVREILIGLKLLEVKNYHLLGEEELNKKMKRQEELIYLKETSLEQQCLRNSLLPGLMKILKENQHQEYPQNLFEIGKVFYFDEATETGVGEKEVLGVVLSHEKASFTEIKQILESLVRSFDLELALKEGEQPSFIQGRVGRIFIEKKEVGVLGEFSPEVLVEWDLKMPVVGLELNLKEIKELIEKKSN